MYHSRLVRYRAVYRKTSLDESKVRPVTVLHRPTPPKLIMTH